MRYVHPEEVTDLDCRHLHETNGVNADPNPYLTWREQRIQCLIGAVLFLSAFGLACFFGGYFP